MSEKTVEEKIREVDIISTAGEFLDKMQKLVDCWGRGQKIVISVPFRDGMGLHYENIKNISAYQSVIDIHTTTPINDDVKKTH